ncbi:MAG: hypothetical protein MZV65_15745 [Chromatiales bacterium]|nr:hypothetical protein [Chromatiales bacterium]
MVYCLAAVFPIKVFNLHIVVGVCRSGGDTKFAAFFDIFGVWIVGSPWPPWAPSPGTLSPGSCSCCLAWTRPPSSVWVCGACAPGNGSGT